MREMCLVSCWVSSLELDLIGLDAMIDNLESTHFSLKKDLIVKFISVSVKFNVFLGIRVDQ